MNVPYKEGDWIAVPLPSGGFAVGMIARAAKGGKALLGYFFGPRRKAAPSVEELEPLDASSAVVIARFGDLALIRSEWKVLGRGARWSRSRWPMPAFASRDPLSGSVWRNEYADGDPNRLIGRSPITEREGSSLPVDGAHGAGAIAKLLDHVLGQRED